MNLIAILGPTSSGKSDMAVDIAEILNTKLQKILDEHLRKKSSLQKLVWIVNCDSRQIYKFLNIGTGKVYGCWHSNILLDKNFKTYKQAFLDYFLNFKFQTRQIDNSEQKNKLTFLQKISTNLDLNLDFYTDLNLNFQEFKKFYWPIYNRRLEIIFDIEKTYFYREIPHFLIDYLEPNISYSLLEYLKDWELLVNFINFLPKELQPKFLILTGGTGLFAKGVLQEYQPAVVKQEFINSYENLKKNLEKLDLSSLQKLYQQIHQQTDLSEEKYSCQLEKLNLSDIQNQRRIQNCLLRYFSQAWTEKLLFVQFKHKYGFTLLPNLQILEKKIKLRLQERVQAGLLQEVEELLNKKILTMDRLYNLGLEYRLTAKFLQGQISSKEWQDRLFLENRQYAKRQYTWLKKELRLGHLQQIYNLSDILTLINEKIKLEDLFL